MRLHAQHSLAHSPSRGKPHPALWDRRPDPSLLPEHSDGTWAFNRHIGGHRTPLFLRQLLADAGPGSGLPQEGPRTENPL